VQSFIARPCRLLHSKQSGAPLRRVPAAIQFAFKAGQ